MSYKTYHAIADSRAPKMRRSFLDAVEKARGGGLRDRLGAALSRGDLLEADRLAVQAWEAIADAELRVQFVDEMLQVMQTAGRTAAPEVDALVKRMRLGAAGSADLHFDITNERAIVWARDRSSTLIRSINDQQRAAIRQLLTRSTQAELAPASVARELRGTIGLLPKQEAAAANYRAELEALAGRDDRATLALRTGRVSNRGLTADKIDAKVERYRQRLLTERADSIARTETIAAVNQGQLEAWQQARDRGILPPDMWKTWIVTPDDRLCPYCRDMEDQTVPIDQPFVSSLGSVMVPPLHPRCRCSPGLVNAPRGRRAAA